MSNQSEPRKAPHAARGTQVVVVRIRDDEIEVSPNHFRLNSDTFPVTGITGVRYGVEEKPAWGTVRKVMRIGLRAHWCENAPLTNKLFHHSDGSDLVPDDSFSLASDANRGSSKQVEIICNRFLRSEQQAWEDFQVIVGAIRQHIVPNLSNRIARQIISGSEYKFGGCFMDSPYYRLSWNGVAFGGHTCGGDANSRWDGVEDFFTVPYEKFEIHQNGNAIHFRCREREDSDLKFDAVSHWNAVIAEAIVGRLKEIKAQLSTTP